VLTTVIQPAVIQFLVLPAALFRRSLPAVDLVAGGCGYGAVYAFVRVVGSCPVAHGFGRGDDGKTDGALEREDRRSSALVSL
jgi:hypothetical protein